MRTVLPSWHGMSVEVATHEAGPWIRVFREESEVARFQLTTEDVEVTLIRWQRVERDGWYVDHNGAVEIGGDAIGWPPAQVRWIDFLFACRGQRG